jgi:hypothetical protein
MENFNNPSEDLTTRDEIQGDLQNLHFPNKHQWLENNRHQVQLKPEARK